MCKKNLLALMADFLRVRISYKWEKKIVKNIAKEQTLNILAKLTGANSNIT